MVRVYGRRKAMTKIEITSDETLTEEEVKKILDAVITVERAKPERTVYVWIRDKNQKERSPEEAEELMRYYLESNKLEGS